MLFFLTLVITVFFLAAAIALGIIPQLNRRSSRQQIVHLVSRPTSRALLTLIFIASSLFSTVTAIILASGVTNTATTFAALGAAAVATAGWIYTSHQSRRLALVSHTQDLIAQHRTSELYEKHRRNIMRRFPVGTVVDADATEDILAQQLSREQHWSDTPPLYYSIQQTLNFHEYIASGVRHDRLDEETIERYQKAILVGAVQKFLPLIKRFREKSKNAYSDIRWLISYWYGVDIDAPDAASALKRAVEAQILK